MKAILRHAPAIVLPALACAAFSPVALAAPYPANALAALQWRLVGPFDGGRADAVAGIPDQPQTFYAGAADGGIWKTTDAGHDWKNVSDCCLALGAVGAIAVAPSDPAVIYAGTGEPFPRGDMATGDGMWKSRDAGKTWQHVGLERTGVVARIRIDPRDANHVYAAALGHVFGPNPERGVYETKDGGAHWRRILYVNAHTGAADLAMDPRDPRVLYASMWKLRRRPWNFSSGGPGSGLYKSTDGGAHWTDIGHNPGLPAGPLGKIGIAIAPSAPDRVYALVEAKAGGVFRSDDGGAHWRRLYHAADITARAFYFGRIYVDPANADRVYAPRAAGLFVSGDGGVHFRNVYAQGGDHHALWINPKHPEIMAVANDGGATITLDGGKSWSSEDVLPLAQFYHVAVDHRFPFRIYGAQQDIGTFEILSRDTSGYGIGRDDWQRIAQWESGYAVPVPGRPWISFSSGGVAGLLERYDERNRQHAFLGPWPEDMTGRPASDLKYRFPWTFPVLISKYDPQTIYVGSQYVMKSADGGDSWKLISPDLTRNDRSKQTASGGPITPDITSVEYYDTVFALAESPLVEGLLWAGTDDGRVWLTRDGGEHWREVTPPALPKWTTIGTIEPSHFKAGSAYLAARRYRQDDYAPYLYATDDYGAHWRKIVHGLPQDESSFVVRQDPKDPALLFAGTLRGVYVSFDDGRDWQPLQSNLPRSAVRDLAVEPRESALVAATHGRGFWVLDNIQPLREIARKTLAAPAFLFTPQAAWLTGGERDSSANSYGEGENPPNGLAVFYELKTAPSADEVLTLTFTNEAGEVLARFSSRDKDDGVAARAGMNEFIWDLSYRVPNPPDTSELQDVAIGPPVVPGRYRVTLGVGDTHLSRDFVVRKDPAIAATQADLERRYALLRRIQDQQIAIAEAQVRIEALRKSLGPAAVTQLDAIAAALVQKGSGGYLTTLQHPVGLREKLGTLEFAVEGSFARPTQSDYELWRVLADAAQTEIAKLQRLEAETRPSGSAPP